MCKSKSCAKTFLEEKINRNGNKFEPKTEMSNHGHSKRAYKRTENTSQILRGRKWVLVLIKIPLEPDSGHRHSQQQHKLGFCFSSYIPLIDSAIIQRSKLELTASTCTSELCEK